MDKLEVRDLGQGLWGFFVDDELIKTGPVLFIYGFAFEFTKARLERRNKEIADTHSGCMCPHCNPEHNTND